MGIQNVIICGLGAVGLAYANKLKCVCNLYILADNERVERYQKNPPVFNGDKTEFDYITPQNAFDADLIIISTKNNGLDSAISYIENFVGENTIILSLLNGIESENKIIKKYGQDKVLHSYFIGHSAVREGNSVTHDGVGKIVFGSPYPQNKEKLIVLKDFLSKSKIDYEIPEDIMYSLWLKFTMNIFSNQASAIMNLTFGEMKKNKEFHKFAKKVISEVSQIASKEGINNADNLEKDALSALQTMIDSGKTSMLQDILAGRKTEVDIFSGEIIKLGKKHGIETPYNCVMHDMIKILEEKSL